MSNENLNKVKQEYEKRIFDLKQLIEISRSLSSTLDFTILIESILYICMSQMKVLNVGLFIKNHLHQRHLDLYRNYKGFEPDHTHEFTIMENSDLARLLKKSVHPCTLGELSDQLPPDSPELATLRHLMPSLVVPLILKDQLVGLLVVGEGMEGESFNEEQKEYIQTIGLFAANAIQNAVLYETATTDMMTQLRLRHFFLSTLNEFFENSVKDGSALSIIFIDIDLFKNLNDTYGHSCGDFVLVKVTSLIRSCIRREDLACRYGGEEFIIMLPGANIKMAMIVAERIRSKVEQGRFIYEKEPVSTTISIGVAQLDPGRDFTTESLIKRADTALYQAKHHGRNRVSRAG